MDNNFSYKDNLQIPAGKYLKWLDPTGVTRNNILGLDTSSNLIINSGKGDIFFNNNATGSNNYFNINNTGNSLFNTKVGIGFSNTSNMTSNLTFPIFSWIGLNSTQASHSGYLGLVGSSSLSNTTGSKILLYGIDSTGGNAGNANIYAGKLGNIQMYTGNNNQIVQILNNGTTNFSPDGSDITISITSSANTITTPINITNTTPSNNATSGALTIIGGVGILGNTYVNGSLTVSSITGNLNFNNTFISTSYSSGTFYISGGFGIACSTPASSITSGGAISIAGGLALGKNAFIGGDLTIVSTTPSTSVVSGSGIFYGGIGISGQTNIRSDQSSQIKITPITTGGETSILFGNQNDYTTTGSWTVGQNVNSIGSTNFGINSKNNGTFITLNNSTQTIFLNKYTNLLNSLLITNNSSDNLITYNDTQGNVSWSIGRIINSNSSFQISRYTQGNFINYILTSDNKTGNVTIFGTENSTSNVSGGSLTVNGGASVSKNLYVGGNVYGGSINFTGSLVSQTSSDTNFFSYMTITATDAAINSSTGCLITLGGITIAATQDTVNALNGGALLVSGGASVSASLNVGNTITSSVISTGNATVTNSTISNIYSINNKTTNITNVNLLCTNNTITNIINTNSTITNMYVSNSSFGNIYGNIGNVFQMTTLNITSTSALITNITSTNSLLTNVSSSNVTITNLLNINSIINNLTIGTILVTSSANLSYNSNTIGGALFTTGGNVGIGITTPNQKLQVDGNLNISNNSQVFIQAGNTNGDARLNVKDYTGKIISFYIGSSKVGGIEAYTAGDIRINSALNTTQLCLSTQGNIGINTNVPIYTLDLNGTFRSQNITWVNNTVNNITNTIGSNNFSSDITLSNSTRNSLIFNSVGVNTPTFTTRSPGSKVVLYPTISASLLDYSIGVETNAIWFSSPSNFKWYSNSTSSNMIFSGTGLAINTNNVSANYALDVTGAGNFTGTIIGGFNSNTLGNIYTTGGNVGINQVSPQFTLDVNGTGRFVNKLSANFNSNTLGNLYTTGGNVGINNTTPNQLVEISPITYNSNLTGGIRIGTSNYISSSDVSYRYIDLRLTSDNMSNFRGSVFGTLGGGTSSEYEYMSFNQAGTVSIYPQTTFLNSTISTSPSIGAVTIVGGLGISNGGNATGSGNGGSLTVGGGGAFSQNVYIGGDLTVTGSILYANAAQASSTFAYLTLTATDNSVSDTSGALIVIGGISIQANGNATSSTSGGGMTVDGGVGIKQDLYVGGTSYTTNTNITNANITISTISNLLVTNTLKATFNSNTLGNLFTTNGNIGIGVVNPAFPLTIGNSNGSNATGIAFIQAGNNPSFGFAAGANIPMWISAPLQTTGGILSLGGSGSIAPTAGGVININNSNFVGINNTNPAFALDITGVLNLRTTNVSSNSSTGTLVCAGGISISKTSNSTSITSGGALTVAGGASIYKDVYVGGTVISSSDLRLKKNIKSLPAMLSLIDNIVPITYNMIDDTYNKTHIGFSAQNIEMYIPELISKENKDSYLALKYDRICAINMKCIQELKQEINKLKEQISKSCTKL